MLYRPTLNYIQLLLKFVCINYLNEDIQNCIQFTYIVKNQNDEKINSGGCC